MEDRKKSKQTLPPMLDFDELYLYPIKQWDEYMAARKEVIEKRKQYFDLKIKREQAELEAYRVQSTKDAAIQRDTEERAKAFAAHNEAQKIAQEQKLKHDAERHEETMRREKLQNSKLVKNLETRLAEANYTIKSNEEKYKAESQRAMKRYRELSDQRTNLSWRNFLIGSVVVAVCGFVLVYVVNDSEKAAYNDGWKAAQMQNSVTRSTFGR